MTAALFGIPAELALTTGMGLAAGTVKAALLDLNTAETGVKAITGATNATPIVVTATAHGFANGDRVIIGAVGGNTAANGHFLIANVATNTFELTTVAAGANVAGNGAYTSGGYAVCLGPSAAGDFWNDFDACVVGTPQTIGSKTTTGGTFDGLDVTFTGVTGATVEAIAIFVDTGTPTTSTMIMLDNGATGLVFTPNSGDATITWANTLNRIFRLVGA